MSEVEYQGIKVKGGRLFGKYKQSDGDSFKIGWTRETGKDLNQFKTNIDDDGVIFFEQEFKF